MYSSKLSISRSSQCQWHEYFMYPSMFRQSNVYNIIEETGRMYLPGALELSTFISKLLVFMWHTLAYRKSTENFKFVNSWDSVGRFLRLYINDCFCLGHLNFTMTLSILFMWWQACKSSGTKLPLLVTVLYKFFPPKHLHEFLQEKGSVQLPPIYYIEC